MFGFYLNKIQIYPLMGLFDNFPFLFFLISYGLRKNKHRLNAYSLIRLITLKYNNISHHDDGYLNAV